MANNCAFYDYIVVSFDTAINKVVLYKCCIKNGPNEYITTYTLNEWSKLDPYEECKKYINDFGLNHDKTLFPFCIEKGAEKECFKENNTLKKVAVYMDFSCNADCTFCKYYKFHRDKFRQNKILREEIKNQYFNTIAKLKGKNIGLELTCVGEPFFYHNEMKNFLKGLKQYDFNFITIVSNGSKIDEEDISYMKASNITFITLISLNVPNEKAYNEIMKLSNFQKTFDTILKIKENNIIISVSFVICRESLKYADDYEPIFKALKNRDIAIEVRPDSSDLSISQSEEFKKIMRFNA